MSGQPTQAAAQWLGLNTNDETQAPLAASTWLGLDTKQDSPVEQKPAAPAAQPPSFWSKLGHQLGLTGRYAIEGGSDLANLLGSPIRAGMNVAGANIPPIDGSQIATDIGLPSPQNTTERIVGDASRAVSGGGLLLGTAGLVGKAIPAAESVANAITAKPGMQLASAATSGGAGGVVREWGGTPGEQFTASVLGGLAPMAIDPMISSAMRKLPSFGSAQSAPVVESALDGMSVPADVKASLQNDVNAAIKTGSPLSQDAIRRLADYKMAGATPTLATLTRNPADFTQQMNLAKIGANSKDASLQKLANVQNTNNTALISGLNNLGAANPGDAYSTAESVINALNSKNAAAQSGISDLYSQARATGGRSALLDPYAFTQQANSLLDDHLLGGKLPSDVRNLLNNAATGQMPLTVDTAEQFKTRLGDLQRASSDAAERKALGLVRQALDNAPLIDNQGQQAIDAFNQARAANRNWMGVVDKTPALQAARNGVEPDRFVQQFVLGNGANASANSVAQMASLLDPQSSSAVKNYIAQYLKGQALNGASDEVGRFSQSGYNKALSSIGERKLSLFFSPEEVSQLKAIGRVASYEQSQPVGSAVNNSNTGGAIAGLLDRIGNSPLLGKVPFGDQISRPAQNISAGMQAKRMMNIQQGLLAAQPKAQMQPPFAALPSLLTP